MTNPARMAAATVLYHPEPDLLKALLDGLGAAGVPVFVHANSALSPEIEALLQAPGIHSVVGAVGNAGLGAGLNAAMRRAEEAGFSHVLLFDQDSAPPSGLPAALLARATAGSGGRPLAALGPRLEPPPGEDYKPIWYSHRDEPAGPGLRTVDFLPTSGSLVPVAAFRAVGPFREDFFIDGIDVEWCFRAWAAGFSVALAQDVTMIHRWGQPDAGAGPQILRQGPLRNYYYLRNGLAGLRLPHLPLRWKWRSAARMLAQAAILLARGSADDRKSLRRAVADAWRGRLGPAT